MNTFAALYIKEMKANKMLFLFLLVLIVGLNTYGLMRLDEVPAGNFTDGNFPFGIVLPTLATFIAVMSLPFLLAHAFNTEWKSETHYQMLSLPVPQYQVILAKVASVGTMGIVSGSIVIGFIYTIMMRLSVLSKMNGEMPFTDFVYMAGLSLLTYMLFAFGLVAGMEGVKYSVKRYRGLTAVAFVFIALYLFGRFADQARDWLDFLGKIQLHYVKDGMEITYSGFSYAPFAYMALAGLVLLGIGLVVYEKRAEI